MVRRRGSRLPWRRQGGRSGAPVPPWIQLGPHYSYVADADYMVLATGVERWADQLDPSNAAKDLVQLGLLNQLTYLPNAGTPSGVPGVQGDGVQQWLEVARTVGFGSGPTTAYAVAVAPLASGLTRQLFGEGSTTGNILGRHRVSGADRESNLQPPSRRAISPGTIAVGVGWWQEYVFDGVTLECTTADGTASVAADPAATDVLTAMALILSGAAIQFSPDVMLWAFGYPRILDPAERVIARAAAQARIG